MSTQTDPVISLHQSKGHYITIDGINAFYLDQGSGPVVFCIHGVPTSSFLFRKVVPQLQERGLRAIAIDLPGLGLSDKPEHFEYTFRHFAAFCHSFLAALTIDQVHLVLHDIGAPIGLFMAAQHTASIQSITVLNAMLDVQHFVKPWPMRPFETPVIGEAEAMAACVNSQGISGC
jgi:pimeloyl-ACP methyl ester carboxylesterase